MKTFKLIVHQKNFSGEDLIINPKDYPGIKIGDVVEIYHQEDEFSRLLLQVTSFKEDLQGRETISVENNIAQMFQLRTYADVHMNIVNPDDVALDSVELTFKDQYMGRSEMWRLKNSLVNTCVYMNKKIEFCGGSIRCQVYEMWTFYNASNLEEFPNHMRECLQQDYRGRFYEDFYRVAVQNERFEDWGNILVQLRKLFTDYRKIVLEYHQKSGIAIPEASNSTAAQGNFLEVLNMSLNVFEKHYLDRSFDRTGQLSVVITPGVGVFEVDRELTNVTKQRIIDNGVGSDLVCVGEQPLHAVPLLKFHNKDTSTLKAPDDYSMPHWINLSFYSTNKKIPYSNFIPRIKLPQRRTKPPDNDKLLSRNNKLIQEDPRECLHNMLYDYDAYDAQVFQLPTLHAAKGARTKKTSVACMETHNNAQALKLLKRKMSDPDIHHLTSDDLSLSGIRSAAITIPCRADDSHDDSNVGSAGSPAANSSVQPSILHRPGRALINPFDPSHVTIKLTSNRRRWTHIFPKGPTGVLIQQHHYQAVPAQTKNDKSVDIISATSPSFLTDTSTRGKSLRGNHASVSGDVRNHYGLPNNKSLTLLWGATGEQEWTPALTTGVDWKSLTIPACLPITTDYFPDKRSLQNDYVVSDYNLLPDDVNADFAQQRAIYKKPLTTAEDIGIKSHISSVIRGRQTDSEPKEEYLLSIGRIFHKISLCGNCITVTRYRPRHPYPPFNIHYRYRFHAPHHDTYETSLVGSSPFRERVGSNRLPEKPRPRSGSKVMDRGRVSPASEAVLPLALEQSQQEHLETNDENSNPEMTNLKSNASNSEILEALKNPQNGISFLTPHPSLPSQTFVSADAVQWLNNHIDGGVNIQQAIKIMEVIFKKNFFDSSSDPLPLGDLQSFENEWVEVEMEAPKGWCQSSGLSFPSVTSPIPISSCEPIDESNIPAFLRDDIEVSEILSSKDLRISSSPYKHTHLDIDLNNKSDRIEWGHLRYQSMYRADHAYELVVQWVASSGSIVADLVFSWQRKAQGCGIQMIPIPSDLLALPYTLKSDPLRGPIFIPLNTECLMINKEFIFEEFHKDTYEQRLFLFQEAILQRFGFLPCHAESSDSDHQYVHITGNVFILVPSTKSCKPRQRTGTNIVRRNIAAASKRYPVHPDQQNKELNVVVMRRCGKIFSIFPQESPTGSQRSVEEPSSSGALQQRLS
ncbi:hypothetical protein G9C98_001299 [Cotesia typhae]|uniref:DEP domain-containing protein 5 n=1 Tax=Cotesia typhae TaxID=2053667 RepID=A0A8J5R0R8_9HYME|nr:hypothetical protein G9C98_001299 [Cotesia typhae]